LPFSSPPAEQQIDHDGADDADQDGDQRIGDDVEIQLAEQADAAAARENVLEAVQPPQAANEGAAGARHHDGIMIVTPPRPVLSK
jgi:hypothetical protein